jgi:hypothetical protein
MTQGRLFHGEHLPSPVAQQRLPSFPLTLAFSFARGRPVTEPNPLLRPFVSRSHHHFT